MAQGIPGTLTRQRTIDRQRVAAAPVLLECEPLRRAKVMQLMQEAQV